ncbi:32268_t:CDS:1, partial [Gigaspora margarita]
HCTTPKSYTTNNIFHDDIMLQDDILSEDDALAQALIVENEDVKSKKEELYLLLDCVKIIIDKNTQMPNAKQWIDCIDKNFNAL